MKKKRMLIWLTVLLAVLLVAAAAVLVKLALEKPDTEPTASIHVIDGEESDSPFQTRPKEIG